MLEYISVVAGKTLIWPAARAAADRQQQLKTLITHTQASHSQHHECYPP